MTNQRVFAAHCADTLYGIGNTEDDAHQDACRFFVAHSEVASTIPGANEVSVMEIGEAEYDFPEARGLPHVLPHLDPAFQMLSQRDQP